MQRDWYPLTPRTEGEPEAASLFPGRPSWHALRRWAREGLLGGRVRLRLTPCGGRLGVTPEDAADFQHQLEHAKQAPQRAAAAVAKPTAAERRRKAGVRRRLQEAGFALGTIQA